MLKRTERLRRHEFGKVAAGRATHTPLFTVRLLSFGVSTSSTNKQFSVVVSKKVAKTAVARNALRRRVYAAIQESGVVAAHAIFYMKPDSLTAPHSELRSAIQSTLKVS